MLKRIATDLNGRDLILEVGSHDLNLEVSFIDLILIFLGES